MSTKIDSPAASESQEEQRALKRRRVEFEDAQTVRGEEAEKSSATDAFAPPKGFKRAGADEVLDEFSLEGLKKKLAAGCELWAVRLPEGVKLRHLDNLQVSLPTKDRSKGSEKIGTFQNKKKKSEDSDSKKVKVDYDVYSVGHESAESSVGAGELLGMTALIGDSKKKQYVPAPIAIKRHLVFRQSLSFPSSKQATAQDDDAEQMQKKHVQPDGLDGFFAPYGFNTKPDLKPYSLPPQASAESIQTRSPEKKDKKKRKKGNDQADTTMDS